MEFRLEGSVRQQVGRSLIKMQTLIRRRHRHVRAPTDVARGDESARTSQRRRANGAGVPRGRTDEKCSTADGPAGGRAGRPHSIDPSIYDMTDDCDEYCDASSVRPSVCFFGCPLVEVKRRNRHRIARFPGRRPVG